MPPITALAATDFNVLGLSADAFPAEPLRLVQPTCGTDGFSVLVPTVRGRSYRLESTPSLAEPHWVMQPPNPGDGSAKLLRDPSGASQQRFYRVRQL